VKYLLQIGVVCGVCWAAQGIEAILPFSFPDSVIGLLLLLALLLLRWVKVEQVQETSDFFTGNLSIFFLPAGVGLMNYAQLLWDHALAFVTICTVSLILTFLVTVTVVQVTVRWQEQRKERGT